LSCGRCSTPYIQPMDDGFELLDAEQAQIFLRRFPRETRKRGEFFLRNGYVEQPMADAPGMSYRASVHDGKRHEVYLSFEPEDGWSGYCTCAVESDCEHMFAAMSALLAEHRTAVVRNLSTGWQTLRTAGIPPGSKTEKHESKDLSQRLIDATGQPLGR